MNVSCHSSERFQSVKQDMDNNVTKPIFTDGYYDENEKIAFFFNIGYIRIILGFTIGEIVWARRPYDGIYWPGQITTIQNHQTNNSNHNDFQLCSYLVQFFDSNYSYWTSHVLPYSSYRDLMSKNLLVYYQSNFHIRNQLIHALERADNYRQSPVNDNEKSFQYFSSNGGRSISSDNDDHSDTYAHDTSSSNYFSTNSYYSPSTSTGFYVGAYPSLNMNENEASLIIITIRNYSAPAFLSYLMNSLTDFHHRSIIYLDETHVNLPSSSSLQTSNTNTLIYLLCLDQFHPSIEHNLHAMLLHSTAAVSSPLQCLYLILNAPCHQLIRRVSESLFDQRSMLVLQYHTTYEHESVLLCSGDRQAFESVRSNVLKYLSNKVKFIDETSSNVEHHYYPSTFQVHSSSGHGPIHQQDPTDNDESLTMPISVSRKLIAHKKQKQSCTKNEQMESECYVKNILGSGQISK